MNDVLSILLPKFIRDSINEKGLTYQEDQGEVAILFCDICDFDSIIEQEKKNIIKLLDKLFRMYDESCNNYGLQKIETVGKTYMAAGGIINEYFLQGLKGLPPIKKYLNSSELMHPVTNCALLAYDMFENAKKIMYGNKQTRLSVKIGIHYGTVMAGVIGGHKPQFSLIGDTVNMASRVCSTGAVDSITLSSEAKAKCYKQLEYLNRNQQSLNLKYKIQLAEKKVEAKGKGIIQTFQIIFSRGNKRHLSRFYNLEADKISQKSNGQQHQQQQQGLLNLNNNNNNINLECSVQILATSVGQKELTNNKDTNHNTSTDSPIKSAYQLNNITMVSKIFNDKMTSHHTANSQAMLENIKPTINGKLSQYEGSINDQPNLKKMSYPTLMIQAEQASLPIQEGSKQHSQQMSMNDQVIKMLGNDIGMIPNIEFQNDIQNDDIDLNRIQQNFSEIQNELSQIQSNDKSIANKISFIDLLKGKYNHEFLIFQMETILNDSKNLKLKSYFLLAFEVFKLVIVNLMSDYIGSRGSTICLIIHMFSIVLLITLIFGYHMISKVGVSFVKLITFLSYLSIIGAIVFEGYSFVSKETNSFFNQVQTSAVIIVFSLFLSVKFYSIQEKIFYSLALIISFLLFSFNNNIARIEYCYITIAIILTQLYNSFQHLELSITSFQNRKKLDIKINEQNKLLQYLLPQHIRDRFLQNQAETINLIDNFDNVSVLYADIAGFTKYSASVKPENVVFMLRELFTKFDQKCQENNVFKLYTIGDCYVVMGLVNVENRDYAQEALNTIEMGFCMIDIIQQVRAVVNFDELEMRIGVHTGSIIGGVVGTGVVRYDIYGPDVVIANKMESNGESGRVMISETTYNLIADQCADKYEFEQEKQVNIPAQKRTIKAFLVKKINKFDSNLSLQYINTGTINRI